MLGTIKNFTMSGEILSAISHPFRFEMLYLVFKVRMLLSCLNSTMKSGMSIDQPVYEALSRSYK